MLKVLIADDEVKVIQLIEYLVDWSSFGMEIIGRVHDGEKALEMICFLKPDVVITDIRMPGLIGIELVQKTQEAGLHPFFVMISGYSEFEYAQKAIQLGVEDYLLKPLRKKDLEAVLGKILEKRRVETETSEALGALTKTTKQAKSKLLTDVLVNQDLTVFDLTQENFYERYGFHFPGSYTECIVTLLFPGAVHGSGAISNDLRFILPKMEELEETRLQPFCKEIISTVRHNEIITLINHEDAHKAHILEALNKLKISVLNYRSISPDLRIAIGVSKPVSSIRQIPSAYLDAKQALARRFLDENRFVFLSEDYFRTEDAAKNLLTPNARKALLTRIELMDADGYASLAKEHFALLKEHLKETGGLRDSYKELCDLFLFGLRVFEDLPSELTASAAALEPAFDLVYTFSDLKAYYIDTCRNVLLRCADEKKALEDKPIRQAKQFIQEHYSEAISLETVSSEVGFNPAYFSTVFKKSTGQNFMDYIKEIRIEHAKDLLARTHMDVAAVAQAVGYTDIKYFTKLFRKTTSLTPTDYRKLYG